MKAVVYDKKALPDKLVYRDVEKPQPLDDEVLIKVMAMSVNAADYRSIKMGIVPKKKILGADVAGRVESVGKNIRRFKPGDDVYGDLLGCGSGGLAEYAVSPEKFLAKKPVRVSFEQAAAIPIPGLTALQALRGRGKVGKGRKVLIVGSGGGVGTVAVQLGKYLGAEVTAVCGPANVDQTKSLGADRVIDYTKEDFTSGSERFDFIAAVNGNYPILSYMRILRRDGICVVIGGSMKQLIKSLLFGNIISIGSKKMTAFLAKLKIEDLDLLAGLVEEGSIRTVIEKRYPLDKAPEAFRYLMGGHAHGKVIVEVGENRRSIDNPATI